MKRAICFTLGLFLVSATAWAQTVTSVKVGLNMPGPTYYVDGQAYNTQQIFLWPLGSKHTVQFLVSVNPQGQELPYQSFSGDIARWTFSGWTDNTSLLIPSASTSQTVTATPALTSLIGQVTLMHRVTIKFFNDPPVAACDSSAPGNPATDVTRYGIVYVDGTCVTSTTDIFMSQGIHNFNAIPYPGYVFAGWLVPGNPPDPYVFQYKITSAMQITANFQPAKRVIFRTAPYGLGVYVDRTFIYTPPSPPSSVLPPSSYDPFCDPDYTRLPPNAPLGYKPLCTGQFDFLPGSVHQISAPVSQQDKAAKWWVFQNFSNGNGLNSTYVTDNRLDLVDTITANFVPGVRSTIITNPSGLPLQVDGRSNWPSYNFIWGEGEKHTISAPALQTDSKGRKWQFTGWSDKGDASHTVTVPAGAQGLSVAANYKLLGQVQVTSNPPGLSLTADGAPCVTPCTFDKVSGSTLAVTAPLSIRTSDVSRYDFDGFAAGDGSTSQAVTFTEGVQAVKANYHAAYLLVTSTNPPNSATFQFSPASPDAFFPEGTQVQVTATAKGGYKFRRWDGDLTTAFSQGYLTMSTPRSVTAFLDKVPFIAPAGVKNAAGDTPDGTIAPGSIISIYGDNLAADLEIGPVNPLAQTIGGVTVTIADRLLPMIFVSPQQINAQVTSDLPDGDYTLMVHRIGQADVTGKLSLRRNSPGLFTHINADGSTIMAATHEDGSAVTADSPARTGETITVFGTGFGPYDHKVVDGFIIPDTDTWKVADPVSVLAGDQTLQPKFAGAATGMVGITIVQVKLTDMPAATAVDFAVTVNGKQSNSAPLPLQ